MFSNKFQLVDSKSSVDYILSPCSLAADGLARIMLASGMQPVILPPHTTVPLGKGSVRRIVAFLPRTPARLLSTLQQIAKFIEHSAIPLPILILSHSPDSWLWHTLLHQVKDPHLLSEVRSAPSDLPILSLTAVLQDYILESYPSLKQLADEEIQIEGKSSKGLTRSELDAILGMLNGHNVNTQAKRRSVSNKTIYNQRAAGLKKMVEYHPHLASFFPRNQTNGQELASGVTPSPFEREFIHAIHLRKIIPFFQPIIDGRMQIQGVEILSRWLKDGNILLPRDFLPQIHSEYTWMVLTAYMLREAVQNINQNQGGVYFSVNIPAAITSNENLIRMVETAHRQLHHPNMFRRLVLEFAENTDPNKHTKIVENVNKLQKLGFRIVLDDCFSKSSVMFPVRTCRFDAYKLDRNIVDEMKHDPHALSLIKTLIYYCKLNSIQCIAEGVDSRTKFNELKALGIDSFQGYLISPPMAKIHMDDFIHQGPALYS